MKPSNRVVLLVGILLAAAAFVVVIALVNQRATPAPLPPQTLPTVYARTNIPLGTVITADMVEARQLEIAVRPADAFGDAGLVIGKTVRTDVAAATLLTPGVFTGGAAATTDVAALLGPGLRAIAVVVDASSGVGSLINVGDRVDLVVGFTADKIPTVTLAPVTHELTTVSGINNTTTKVIIQNMQVIGTPVLTAPGGAAVQVGTATTQSLLDTPQLIILAVTAQQAEVIKFAQIDGSISLVLRSPRDFRDANGNPVEPQPDNTSGVILKTLIDKFGVLPPQVIQATNIPTAP